VLIEGLDVIARRVPDACVPERVRPRCVRSSSFLLVFLLVCSLPAASAPPAASDSLRVRSIQLRGNDALDERRILGLLETREGSVFDSALFAADMGRIEAEYRSIGFLGAVAVPGPPASDAESTRVDLLVTVTEGPRAVVREVRFTGAAVIPPEELSRLMDTRPGDPLDERTLEADIAAVLRAFERAGHPLARCVVSGVEAVPAEGDGGEGLVVTLALDQGRRVTIDEVRVEGNRETDASVIVREARVNAGELYDPRKMERIRSRLQRLNIFADVSEPELYLREERAGLLIQVREGSSNTFDGVVGYVPAGAAGESGTFTGLISVGMRNLFGTGRKLNFRWQRDDRNSQDLAVRYLEPWLFGWPVNAGVGFHQRQQDTTFVRRVLDGRLELMVNEEVTVALVGASESVIPSASAAGAFTLRSSTFSLGAELLYDSRDDPVNPTGGGRFRTDYLYGRKKVSEVPAGYPAPVDVNSSVGRLTVDADLFLETFARQVFALGIHGRELTGAPTDEAQMYRFGGARTLRGYRENQFVGTRLAWTNVEYRFLLARRSFLFGFFDAGYYLRPEDPVRGNPLVEEFKPGYGVGLLVDTPLGVMSVSFALGEGDSFSQGKVHVGILNEF
jgi:outer membrane protein insertion porin family